MDHFDRREPQANHRSGRRRLDWGMHYLMCPPDHFDVVYEINPWMHRTVRVDRARARLQWQRLVEQIRQAGAQVDVMPAVEGVPDLVFCANAGLVSGRRFVPARFRHPERRPETPIFTRWFAERGYVITPLEEEVFQEGVGDALPFGDVLVCGYRQRSDARAATLLSEMFSVPARTVELVDERLYHLDLVFCPLDSHSALIAGDGLDRWGRRVLEDLVPDPIWLTLEEALGFAANSVVVSDRVIMPSCSPRLEEALKLRGFEVSVSPVDEFVKAGGAVRCLTLPLDLTLGSSDD